MEFYKKREFGEFISDSFGFFKIYGKNYFKNYLFLNGILLILLVAIFIFAYKEIFAPFLGSNLDGQGAYFDHYFEDNIGMIIGIAIVAIILFIMLSIVNYLFPVFYLKRLSEGEKRIRTDDIVNDFKNNIGKIAILILGMTFIVVPLSLIVLGITYALIFVVIGFFLFLFVFIES